MAYVSIPDQLVDKVDKATKSWEVERPLAIRNLLLVALQIVDELENGSDIRVVRRAADAEDAQTKEVRTLDYSMLHPSYARRG